MENKFVTRRKIKHTDNHFDIEELRTDSNGNEVWAVTFCSEENMNGYTASTDLETRVNNLFAQIPQEYHTRAVMECYGEDDHDFERKLTAYVMHRVWETYDHPAVEAWQAERMNDPFRDERLDPQLNCHNIAVDVAAYNVLHAVPANKEWAEKRLMEETEKRNKYLGGDTNKV